MTRAFCGKLVLSVVCFTIPLAGVDRTAAQPFVDPSSELPASVDIENDQELLPPPEVRDTAARPAAYFQPYLGVTFDPQVRNAAVAMSVNADSPAAQAGLQPGDEIEAINGRRVASYRDVLDLVAARQPGERLDIDYSRRISVRTQAVLDGRPAEARRSTGYAPNRPPSGYRFEPGAQAAYEQLPPPANYLETRRPLNPQYNSNPATRGQAYGIRSMRADEEDRQRRLPDRDPRRLERGDRIRALLPWRRD